MNISTQLELSNLRTKVEQISLNEKVELLTLFLEETQKYELLTTNQYLKHMNLIISILDDLIAHAADTHNKEEPGS